MRQKAQDQNFCENASNWLWIDQISINQEAVEERNHQVEQMSIIYRQARRVTIWLGTATEETSRAMLCLERGRNWSDGTREKHILCLETIASLKYWQRLWIIQEIVLAHRIVLICGERQIKWSDLALHVGADVNDGQVDFAAHRRIKARSDSAMSALIDFRGPGGGGFSTWKQGLQISREAQCEDPRDRVYGMLSLLQPSLRVPVDYNATVEELFWSVINNQIQDDKPEKFGWDWHRFRSSSSQQFFDRPQIESSATLAKDLAHALGLPLSFARTTKIQSTLARERLTGIAHAMLDKARSALHVVGKHTIPEDLHKMLRAEYNHWRYGNEAGRR